LSGDVSVFVASPIATSSIPTFGPKRVIGANRVSSYGEGRRRRHDHAHEDERDGEQ
jgi:hypothetical protein